MGSVPADMPFDDMARVLVDGMYFRVAAMTISLYDHLTTIDLEIELIWKKKLSFVQILYFINRYAGDAVFVHGVTYQTWLKGDAFVKVRASAQGVQMWLSMVTLWAMQGIIINRVWCMYRYSKPILIVLMSIFIAQCIAGIVIAALDTSVGTVIPLLPGVNVCAPIGFMTWYWAFLCFIIAFDLLIFVLALLEGIRYFRHARTTNTENLKKLPLWKRIASPWITEGSIVQVLLRDSILFPFIGMVACVFAMISWLDVLPYGAVQITMVINALTSPVLGSRLLLNLRDAYYQPFAQEVNPTRAFPTDYNRNKNSMAPSRTRTLDFPMSFDKNLYSTGGVSINT